MNQKFQIFEILQEQELLKQLDELLYFKLGRVCYIKLNFFIFSSIPFFLGVFTSSCGTYLCKTPNMLF